MTEYKHCPVCGAIYERDYSKNGYEDYYACYDCGYFYNHCGDYHEEGINIFAPLFIENNIKQIETLSKNWPRAKQYRFKLEEDTQ